MCYDERVMVDIRFDPEDEFTRSEAYTREPRGMTALVMKWGLAKDEKMAQYVLLGIAVGVTLLAFLAPKFIDGSQLPVSHTQINAPVPPAS